MIYLHSDREIKGNASTTSMPEASIQASCLNIFMSRNLTIQLYSSAVRLLSPSRGAGTHHIPAPRMAHERH